MPRPTALRRCRAAVRCLCAAPALALILALAPGFASPAFAQDKEVDLRLSLWVPPAHPLTGRFAAPRGPLVASVARLAAEGMAEEGEELSGRVVLPPGLQIAALAEQTFPQLWRLWDICHGLAGTEAGG